VVGFNTCGYISGTWYPATIHDRAAMRFRVYVDLYVCVYSCTGVCCVSVKTPAHSVRACVHGRKYIYMHDEPMRSARIVRAPAPWIIQWDDLPILRKQTGPMVTAKGGATMT